MSAVAVLMLALALAMDAFAVSVGAGCALRRPDAGHYFRMSLAFGLFQFLMPVIGWALGLSVRSFIENWDHWVAFVLLAWIGGSMLREGLQHNPDDDGPCAPPKKDPSRGTSLLLLAVATSIDALAVGLSFALIRVPIWMPSVVIGLVCAGLTALGLFLGQRLSRAALFGRYAGVAGGVVLIGIGLKILWEHGVFA
ncbi:MAG TPA: manganese efflux pump [Candidatus Avidesulfovibrio excrementigallinarum]|nr:manganese efflux pump [Candidatus Avidesulfovibrio excrementigallinarum]